VTANQTATSPKPSTSPPGGRDNRSPKNLLIDRRFQLKYTTFIVLLAIAISAPLGAVLYGQATEMAKVAAEANAAARDAVEQAKQLNTRLAFEAMTTAKGDPSKVERVTRENDVATAGIEARAKALAGQAAALGSQRALIGPTLVATLGLLVVLVGLLGITFTHRVAGPIHHMRTLFKEVGDGQLAPTRPLRKGDELKEFFQEFSQMVGKLRDRQRGELERLDVAIRHVESSGADTDSISDLRVARDAIRTAIEQSLRPPPTT
jgi:methyl-accepting chemotaxis protein